MRRIILLLALIALVAYCYWPSASSEITPAPSTLKTVTGGDIIGYTTDAQIAVWRGVPFAASTGGDNRWRAPRPVASWRGVRDAIVSGPPCVQETEASGYRQQIELTGSEDCLNLDIYAPEAQPGSSLPVLVVIHGGANSVGSAGHIHAEQLARKENAVVVVLQYRLGIFGWFAHPELVPSRGETANFALLDMIAALNWVRDNVQQFGGDSANVTLLGESSGAHNTALLLSSPLAQGLFQRAVMMSGFFASLSYDEAATGSEHFVNDAETILSATELADTSLEALRKAPVEVLMKGVSHFSQGAYSPDIDAFDVVSAGIEDGVTVPATDMLSAIAVDDDGPKPAVIIGGNRDELRSFLGFDPRLSDTYLGMIPRLIEPELFESAVAYGSRLWLIKGVYEPAQAYARAGHKTYVYRFDWDDTGSFLGFDSAPFFGAAHSMGLAFVFSDFVNVPMAGILYPEEERQTQRVLANQMSNYIGSFARSGRVLAGADGVLWPGYTSDQPAVMIFDTPNDGGLRIARRIDSYADWLRDLKTDPSLDSDDRCFIVSVMSGLARSQEADIKGQLGCGELRRLPNAL